MAPCRRKSLETLEQINLKDASLDHRPLRGRENHGREICVLSQVSLYTPTYTLIMIPIESVFTKESPERIPFGQMLQPQA